MQSLINSTTASDSLRIVTPSTTPDNLPHDSASIPKPSRIRTILSNLFAIDLRSLAALRIGLALLLLCDLANRLPDLTAHYSDAGLLPRSALIDQFSSPYDFSIYLTTGQPWGQAILFAIAGAIALMLLAGFRTRLATLLSWFMLVSLQNRNPLLLDCGDTLLRMLLFWSIFLPLGAHWSVDAIENRDRGNLCPQQPYLSVGSMALLLQIAFMYLFTAIQKNHPIWWHGQAILRALQIQQFATPFGMWLDHFPALLRLLTWSTLAFEFLGPILIFTPFLARRIRPYAIFAFWMLHLGMALCLALGHFPFICMTAWIAFIPGPVWDRLHARLAKPLSSTWIRGATKKARKFISPNLLPPLVLRGRAGVGAERVNRAEIPTPRFFPGVPAEEEIQPPERSGALISPTNRRSPILGTLSAALASIFLIAVLLWNFNTIALAGSREWFPRWLIPAADVFRIDQNWSMFAPYPMTDDGWYVIPGNLADGSQVDLFSAGLPVSWEKPAVISHMYSSTRWRKYMINLCHADCYDFRIYYARYLARQWNATHTGDKTLKTFQICYMEREIADHGPLPPRKIIIWTHDCSK